MEGPAEGRGGRLALEEVVNINENHNQYQKYNQSVFVKISIHNQAEDAVKGVSINEANIIRPVLVCI